MVAIAAAAVLVGGCGSSPRAPRSGDPLADLLNPRVTDREKQMILGDLPGQLGAGTLPREAAAQTLRDLVWLRHTTGARRAEALRILALDPGLLPEDEAFALIETLLPTERDEAVSEAAARIIASRNWTRAAPALVRRYAVPDSGVPDAQRLERAALEALHPETTVEETVFRVFLEHGPGSTHELADKIRRDAWNLLSRLDASGDRRVEFLGKLAADETPREDQALAALRRGLIELRTIPLTGEELEWLTRLSDPADPATEVWWRETNEILRTLDAAQRRGLRLRHAEALRWAGVARRELTRVSRESLLTVLGDRLASRQTHRRSSDAQGREDLETWSEALSYADLVSLLVLDDAIREPRVVAALFEQVGRDRDDTSTEYGGVLRAASVRTSSGSFTAVPYPPRPISRVNDTSFVASREMIEGEPRALAHYHFHAQTVRNRRFAGPSDGDLRYAALYGRTCVVLTTVEEGVMNADVYLPSGVILDLGEIRAEASAP